MQPVEQERCEARIRLAEDRIALAERPHGTGEPVRLARVGRIGQLHGDRARVQRAVLLLPQHHASGVLPGRRLEVGQGAEHVAGVVPALRVSRRDRVPQEHDRGTCDVVGVVRALAPVPGGGVPGPSADPAVAARAVGIRVGPRRPDDRTRTDLVRRVRGRLRDRHVGEQEPQVGEVRQPGAGGRGPRADGAGERRRPGLRGLRRHQRERGGPGGEQKERAAGGVHGVTAPRRRRAARVPTAARGRGSRRPVWCRTARSRRTTCPGTSPAPPRR